MKSRYWPSFESAIVVTHESRKFITWVEEPFQTRGPFPDNYRARKTVVVNVCWLGPARLFLRSVWFEYLISGAKSYREFRETGLSPLTLEKTEHKLCAKPVGSFSLIQLRLTCVIFWVWRCCFFGRNKHKLEISYMYIAEIKKKLCLWNSYRCLARDQGLLELYRLRYWDTVLRS